ncbi:MAG: hypothetical protein ABSG31_17215 [Tepidisphaeraceae bacterium]|jgi:hypothetical protein
MGHIGFAILIVGAALIFGWLMFALWVLSLVLRIFGKVIGGILRGLGILPPRRRRVLGNVMLPCARIRCAANNPVNARFCRRCGAQLSNHAPAQSRQAMAACL